MPSVPAGLRIARIVPTAVATRERRWSQNPFAPLRFSRSGVADAVAPPCAVAFTGFVQLSSGIPNSAERGSAGRSSK